MRALDRIAVIATDLLDQQHPRTVYYRPRSNEISNGAKYAGRIVKMWLWFLSPFVATFAIAVFFSGTMPLTHRAQNGEGSECRTN